MSKPEFQAGIESYAKEAQELREKIKAFIDKWSWIVTDYGWKFDSIYCASSDDMPDGHEDAAGVTFSNFKYLEGNIYFNIRKLYDKDDDWIEEMVIHEICHMLLNPYDPNTDTAVEYVTTTVSRAFSKLRNIDRA